MTYDHWKTTNPADEFLGPDPNDCEEEEPIMRDVILPHPLACRIADLLISFGDRSELDVAAVCEFRKLVREAGDPDGPQFDSRSRDFVCMLDEGGDDVSNRSKGQ
jgi:hypothetical protein